MKEQAEKPILRKLQQKWERPERQLVQENSSEVNG